MDNVEVVAPTQIPEHAIHQFVQERRQWIEQALHKMASKNRSDAQFAPAVYGNGAEIIFQGQAYQLLVQSTKLKKIKIELSGHLQAYIPESLLATDFSPDLKTAVLRWLKNQALLKVRELVALHAAKKQLFPRAITIKTQKSRWGSCGIHDEININWLLVIAPPDVLEYVVVHELCHIQERNHSPKFWALVAEHLPGYKSSRQWLKQQGGQLMRVMA